jgi:hypothetical protein
LGSVQTGARQARTIAGILEPGDAMKHPACHFCLIAAAMAAAPAAWSGPDILRCVDRDGRVTLTDQPCPAGSIVDKVVVPDAGGDAYGGSGAAGSTGAGGPQGPSAAPLPQHMPAPSLPPLQARPGEPARHAPMPGDAATLKAARAQMLIKDESAHQGAQPPAGR